jgi:uncharacterized protein YndB with AHSA1/START domain
MTDTGGVATGIGRMWPDGERFGIDFTRHYRAEPATVWAAITDPAELPRWFAPVGGDLRAGGRYAIDFGEESQTGEVRACDAPTALTLTWDHPDGPASLVTVTLAPSPAGGTTLTLRHEALPGAGAAGYSAGWHAYLDRLAAHLTAHPLPAWDDVFHEAIGHYKRQLAMIPTVA